MSNSFFEDLIDWIEANLADNLTIHTVALQSGYSTWHLQRIFRKATGVSLGEYIRVRRLTNAALALSMTTLPIIDILMINGFDSQQTFTRSFRNHFGITPARYRRQEKYLTSGFQPRIKYFLN